MKTGGSGTRSRSAGSGQVLERSWLFLDVYSSSFRDFCVTLGVGARKTLSPTLSQRRPLRNPSLVARTTPHRIRPKTADSASPLGEGEERRPLE